MSSFLTLSREVRDMIYGYSLIVEGVEIIPYPLEYERSSDEYQEARARYPSPALLAVNKLIRAEAIPVLYGGNTWRLVHGLYTPGSCIFLEHPMAFQNINLVFDQRDLPEIKKVEVSREIHAKNFEFSHTTNISAARVRAVHSRHISLMTQLIWEKAWSLMKTLQGVKTITVDLAYFGCPSGCCRVLQMKTQTALYLAVLKHLRAKALALSFLYRPRYHDLPRVIVKGLLNEEERELIYGVYKFEDPGE